MTKKNHSRIITNPKTKRTMLIPSKAYTEYKKRAAWYVRRPEKPITEPVNARYIFYMPTRRRVDIVNLQAAVDDLLTELGVFADDNRDIVAAHDGSRVCWDKAKPRTEVTITALPDENYTQWGTYGDK